MNFADFINGSFELCGAWFIYLHIRQLLRDRMVRGVYWPATAFFALWGWWNLYYYPSLGQWLSFAGGVAIVATNTTWTAMLVYFTRKERKGEA